jgi:hypothetical protein
VKKRSKIIQEQKTQKQNKNDMDIHWEQSNQFAQQTIQVQMQADAEKQKTVQKVKLLKKKGGTRPIDSSR